MLIVFANQKGGCGKTTNCIQFANFLAAKKKQVVVFDVDFQKSITDRRKADEISITTSREEEAGSFDNELPYEVFPYEAGNMEGMIETIKNVEEGVFVLVDCPGTIEDDLEGLLKSADYLIIPFSYDRLTLDSTAVFILLLDALGTISKRIFLPNRIKGNVKYDTVDEVNAILSEHGVIAPVVPDRIALERISTLGLMAKVEEAVDESYTFILEKISTKS